MRPGETRHAWIAACLAVILGACTHDETPREMHPCDGWVELVFQRVPDASPQEGVLEERVDRCSHSARSAASRERGASLIGDARALLNGGKCKVALHVAEEAFDASRDLAALELAAVAARCTGDRLTEIRVLHCIAATPGADATRTAAALAEAERATGFVLVRCVDDQGYFDYTIDADQSSSPRSEQCGKVMRLNPGSHSVHVHGQSGGFGFEVRSGERVVLVATRREHGC